MANDQTVYGASTYGGGAYSPYRTSPDGLINNGTLGAPAVGTTSEPPAAGYGSGTYNNGTYSGTAQSLGPATIIDGEIVGGQPTAAAGYGAGTYGDGPYSSAAPPVTTGYGSGPYGAGIYPGTIPTAPGAAIPEFTDIVFGPPLHLLGIGPWNPVKAWRGAVNYGIGKGKAPARPVMQLPGVQSKTLTLRLAEGGEATANLSFPRGSAVVVEDMSTDLWWRRKDPVTGRLEMLGRFNCSNNDMSRDTDGAVASSLQFNDYRTVLGNRMVLKYKDTANAESLWPKDTPVTEIMKFAVPTDQGIDLTVLDDPDICGVITTPGFTLPPYNTIAQTFEQLLAASSKTWEWWVDTPTDITKAPKLTFAQTRGADRGVTLFDLGAGPTPIASWQMRAASDTYANTLYFQGGSTTSTTPAGGVIVNEPEQVVEFGQRDAQDSDNSVAGSLEVFVAAAKKRLTVMADRRPTFTVTLKQGWWKGRAHIDIGDKVRLRIRLGNELIAYEYRVTELRLEVDNSGAETVTLTLGTPLASSNPRSQFSPFFRLVRALKNYVAPDGSDAYDAR